MKVLLVTDLSEAGRRSVEGLCACGSAGFGSVTLLHVVDLDLYTAGGSVPQIMDWARGQLEEMASELRATGFEVTVRVETGPAIDTIKAVADDTGADLIVATNLGKGALTGRLLGSTAERLPSATDTPVLIERVRHEEEKWCRVGSGSPFDRVLVGVDLQADPSALVSLVRSLPGVKAILVVHVAEDEAQRADAQRTLDDAIAGAEGPSTDALVVVGDPADQLLAQARDFDATAIAVASCQHGMLHRGVLGSVARAVTTEADRGVLLLPPR